MVLIQKPIEMNHRISYRLNILHVVPLIFSRCQSDIYLVYHYQDGDLFQTYLISMQAHSFPRLFHLIVMFSMSCDDFYLLK